MIMVAMPQLGQRIRVVLDNTKTLTYMRGAPHLRAVFGRTREYVGTVVASDPLDPPNTFNLTTDDPKFPVRCITLSKELLQWTRETRRIAALPRKIVKATPVPILKDKVVKVKSKTQKGVVYTITYSNGIFKHEPPCKGFGFRGMCSHVDEAARKLGLKR